MLNLNINSTGLVFSVNIDGHDIHFKEWMATDDCIYYLPLATLVDNGCATFYKHKCTVPYENVYMLDEDDKALLGIPESYNKAIRLRSESMLNCSDFKYKLEYLTHAPDGDVLPFERGENILSLGANRYLLNENQYQLVKAVEDFNAKEEAEKTLLPLFAS